MNGTKWTVAAVMMLAMGAAAQPSGQYQSGLRTLRAMNAAASRQAERDAEVARAARQAEDLRRLHLEQCPWELDPRWRELKRRSDAVHDAEQPIRKELVLLTDAGQGKGARAAWLKDWLHKAAANQAAWAKECKRIEADARLKRFQRTGK